METHPFYRLPSVESNASVREIILERRTLPRRRTVCEARALLGIKELLKKPLLQSNDLRDLMQHLEQLVAFVVHHSVGNIDAMRPKHIVATLAPALLVMDAIFAASQVLGQQAKRSRWWQQAGNETEKLNNESA